MPDKSVREKVARIITKDMEGLEYETIPTRYLELADQILKELTMGENELACFFQGEILEFTKDKPKDTLFLLHDFIDKRKIITKLSNKIPKPMWTEEELDKVLPKKKELKKIREGQCQEMADSIQEINSYTEVYNQAITDCKQALLGREREK